MNGEVSITRRPASEKSNVELINALRSNFLVSKQAFDPVTNGSSHPSSPYSATNGISPSVPYSTWTARENGSLFVPSIDFSHSGLAEERSQYDITVKLFFLPHTSASERRNHTQEAVDLVLKELHMPSIDLLIVSFPGVSFDADDEDEEEEEPNWSPNGEGEDLNAMAGTWKALEYLHEEGIALQIGVSEFGSERLQKFLPRTKIRPSVDQINVRDCCVVPKSLILYAKQEKIELLTHNDCTNVLPSGTVRELLGTGEKGAGVLTGPDGSSDGLKGEVEPQWVVKYTAVVRDRGVIENKGYFAMAEVRD
jgi:glutamate--cysteine ligase regulatory subunit